MHEDHDVFIPRKLLMAGDVELNPGPYNPELLANLVVDLAPVKSKCLAFGVQLGLPMDEVQAMEMEHHHNAGIILHHICHHWLSNTPEGVWFQRLCAALERVGNSDLATFVKKKYMASSPADSSSSGQIIPSSNSSKLKAEMDDDVVAKFESCDLQFWAMDQTEMDCFPEVKKDTNEVIFHFTKLCDSLYKFIKSDDELVEDLRYLIQSWIHCGTIDKNDPYQKITKAAIENIQSYRKLWQIFSSYCSFFNFRLVERAINIMNFEEGTEKLQEYKSVFCTYLKRRVTQCPSGIGMKGEDHVTVIVKLDEAFADCRIEHLQLLAEDIGKALQVKVEKIQLDGVRKGSICVTFHIHNSAIAHGFFILDHQIKAFKNLRYSAAKIRTIKCGSVQYLINEGLDCTQDGKISKISYCDSLTRFDEMLSKARNSVTTIGSLRYNNIAKMKESMKRIEFDPHHSDGDGNTAIHGAAMEGSVTVTRYLIEDSHMYHRQLNTHQHSLLHLAAAHGHLELVQYLTKDKDLHPLSPDIHGWTPVHYAIAAGHLDVVKLFSEREGLTECLKSSVICYKGKRFTALHIAIGSGDLDMIRFLLAAGVSPKDSSSLILSTKRTAVLKHLLDSYEYPEAPKGNAVYAAVGVGNLESVVRLVQATTHGTSIVDIHGNTLLHYASQNGHLDVVMYLVDSSLSNLTVRNDHNNSPLHLAALNGKLEVVKFYVEVLKVDWVAVGRLVSPLLHCACMNGHLDVIKYLVDSSVGDPMATDSFNNTPLHLAACGGFLDVVKYFIEDLHLDPNLKGENGRSPLHYAGLKGHKDVVKCLVNSTKLNLLQRDDNNDTVLHLAALNDEVHIVQYLIEDLNFEPNMTGQFGMTALHYASQNGHMSTVRLLSASPPTNSMARDEDDDTPLHLAALNGHESIVRYFIKELNYDPNIKGQHNLTPLQYAIQNGHLDIVRYFTESHFTDPAAPDEDNNTLLHLAALCGNTDMVRYFIQEANCDPNIGGEYGLTPLHYASQNGHLEVIKLLTKDILVDPMVRDVYGNTALHIAAINDNLPVFRYFVEQLNLEPNMKGFSGTTPLLMASVRGGLDFIKYLVEEQHCYPMIGEESPLLIAEGNGNQAVAVYLKEKFPVDHHLARVSAQHVDSDHPTMQKLEEKSRARSSVPQKLSARDVSEILYKSSTLEDKTMHKYFMTKRNISVNNFRDLYGTYVQ